MKTKLLVLLLLTLTAGCRQQPTTSISNTLGVASVESQGISPERIARIDSMLKDAVGQNNIPGAVALIARNGKIVMHNAYGQADVGAGAPFEKNDIFRIASQTKAITATAVMMLWEEGRFQLDDPISEYIPEFAQTGILETFDEADSSFTITTTGKPISIRHLLSHTSGIGYGVIDGDERFRKIYAKAGITDLFTTEPVSLEENIALLAQMPLHHEPGEGWTYSEGLDVLGRLVEVVSGMPFDRFLKNRLFDPLGMEDTWFYLPSEKEDRLVPVQHRVEGTWERFQADFYNVDYPKAGSRTFFSGGAGLSSTARDYAVFLQMYLNKGAYNGVRILSRTTVETIMANQIGDLWAGGPKHYGLAFGVVHPEGLAFGGQGGEGTFDWGGYFNTQYFADPGENLIGILMKQTQNTTEDETGWKFRQMVFAAIDD
jgi:CubicO group peptidase (beta-lactamase class C family)